MNVIDRSIIQERDDDLHKRDFINARQRKTLVALHGNAFIANQEQLKGCIFTKVMYEWTNVGYDPSIVMLLWYVA